MMTYYARIARPNATTKIMYIDTIRMLGVDNYPVQTAAHVKILISELQPTAVMFCIGHGEFPRKAIEPSGAKLDQALAKMEKMLKQLMGMLS